MDKQEAFSKIGQHLVVGFPEKTISDNVKRLIHDYRVGNFILFSRNIGSPEDVYELTSRLQEEAKKAGHPYPLLICTDQENGYVRRLKEGATAFPGAMALGATENPDIAYQIGKATANELKALGMNWNLAPVVDVNNNPNNPVINVRSFGESPEKVAQMAVAWMTGCQDGGVAATLKHFPGHGDTDIDSHLDLPKVNHPVDRLHKVELFPFKEGIKNGAEVIMSAHIYFPAIEREPGRPATLSKAILTDLLRHQLGFNGVITTDCLEMKAIADTIGTATGALQALQAGADIAMISHTYDVQLEAIRLLTDALQAGELDAESIEKSERRIIELKERYALTSSHTPYELKNVGSAEHSDLACEVIRKSITVIKKEDFQTPTNGKILAVYPKQTQHNQAEDQYPLTLGHVLLNSPANLELYEWNGKEIIESVQSALKARAEACEGLIIFTLAPDSSYIEAVKPLLDHKNIAVVALKSPYDLRHFEGADLMLCTYNDSPAAIKAALEVIYGRRNAPGRLPVTLE
ncbi:beta-N-acetylhexosaminidase [Camelliibacillus cellulosilyticus]|uniref:beta-N-acetylhexosaminidase n=1 Tax=Camelliibacillus cellulosilyticus TaxID=2174486 RepID=A0ABV9GLN5_9BACL